jgi:hypothetical protein
VEIGQPARLLVEVFLFSLAAAALCFEAHGQLAACLVVVAFTDRLLLLVLDDRTIVTEWGAPDARSAQ